MFQMRRVEVSVMTMNSIEVFQEDLTDSVAIAVSCRSNFVCEMVPLVGLQGGVLINMLLR